LKSSTEQASCFILRFSRVFMHRKAGSFEIDEVSPGTRASGWPEGVLKAAGLIATGDQSVRAVLAAYEICKFLQVTVGMGSELNMGGGKVETLFIERHCILAIAKKNAPLSHHFVSPHR
jgi:hypothetical protein